MQVRAHKNVAKYQSCMVSKPEDMQDREAKLADKEKRIVELKNDIRGLEKLKFLQDHQMMAMKEEIEPLTQELSRMRDHQVRAQMISLCM